MDAFEWDESLNTGDALVDQQHRDIHALVDGVAAAGDRPDELRGVLARLMEHVDCHFATEEALMKRSGYVGQEADDHVAAHRELTEAARDAVLRLHSGELTSTKPVAEFLRVWLAEHVHERDRRFIEFVRSNGAAATLPGPWASDPPMLDSEAG